MKSCKDITLLIEKRKITKISFKEKIQVKFHLAMCKLCRNFAVDSAFLDRVLARLKPRNLKLTDEEKSRVKDSLNRDKK